MTIETDGLLHVAVVTRRLDALVAFWTDVFGARVVRELTLTTPAFGDGVGVPGAAARTVHVRVPGADSTIEITGYREPLTTPGGPAPANTCGIRHFALRTPDITAAATELTERGIEIVGGPVTVDEPAAVRGTRFLYFRDPDGNLVELIEPAGS